MGVPALKTPTAAATGSGVHDAIAEERTHDLVFAIVAYAGAGGSEVARVLTGELRSSGFSPQTIEVSDLLKRSSSWVSSSQPSTSDLVQEHEDLQALGDSLRSQFGVGIAAGLAVREIFSRRQSASSDQPLAFVVDSLKNPAEVEVLRSVYGAGFYLVGVVCDPRTRRERLRLKLKEHNAQRIDVFASRDEDGGTPAGQQVRRTLHLADFFVSNQELVSTGTLSDGLSRIVQLITGSEIVRPSPDERGMAAAWSAALRSACLSRQVGAAILSAEGDVIATGTNDVPMFGGGLYENHSTKDHRCFKVNKACSNDIQKNAIFQKISSNLRGLLKPEARPEEVRSAVEIPEIRSLIEFSRSVHAEMDALISLARSGGPSSKGTTLYTTTYPCHGCARHLVAAGVSEVVYIEPYPKSLAITLHNDSIEDTIVPASSEGTRTHVGFRLFSGVAPRRFSLFEKRTEIKDRAGGLLLPKAGANPEHVDPVFNKGLRELEKKIAESIDDIARAATTEAS